MPIANMLSITSNPFLSMLIWIALLLAALYFARKPFHRAISSLCKIIHNAMRLTAASVLSAEKRLSGVGDRILSRLRIPVAIRPAIWWIWTFHLVCLAWIFFRAAAEDGGLAVAWQVIEGIAACDFRLTSQVPLTAMLLVPVVVLIDYLSVSRDRQLPLDGDTPLFVRGLAYGSAVVMMILANSPGDIPFLYFQF